MTGESFNCFDPPILGRWIHISGGILSNAPYNYTGKYSWLWCSPGQGDCVAFLWSVTQHKLWVAHFGGTSHTGSWFEINLTEL